MWPMATHIRPPRMHRRTAERASMEWLARPRPPAPFHRRCPGPPRERPRLPGIAESAGFPDPPPAGLPRRGAPAQNLPRRERGCHGWLRLGKFRGGSRERGLGCVIFSNDRARSARGPARGRRVAPLKHRHRRFTPSGCALRLTRSGRDARRASSGSRSADGCRARRRRSSRASWRCRAAYTPSGASCRRQRKDCRPAPAAAC